MRKIVLFSGILLSLMNAIGTVADTGTYEILDYSVTLTPHSSGEVNIDYDQEWLVTGGSIPWITVGVPNGDFSIREENSGGASSGIRPSSAGGWSGVRIDLDKDYRPGETFKVRFSIVQRGLFFANDTDYFFNFTPGWYDRAPIGNLTVKIICFAPLAHVKVVPAFTRLEGQTIVWERKNLSRGARFTAGISFPRTLFTISRTEKYSRSERSGSSVLPLIAFIGIVFILFVSLCVLLDGITGRYSGGTYSSGGGFRRSGGSGGEGGSDRSAGGGGGFGGGGFSCACACAGCACACACAGGGGAGCSRKLDHSCPLCSPEGENS